MFPLNTILAWNINIIMNKKYDNNNIIIASRAYFLHIGIQLLSQFDSEADEEDDDVEVVVEEISEVMRAHDAEVETAKGTGKNKWGPILATRMSSRIVHDGKSMIEKAKELKKCKNLEKPSGMPSGCHNSFAVLNNVDLLHKAHGAGHSLGTDMVSV
jgi:hypothetical protein